MGEQFMGRRCRAYESNLSMGERWDSQMRWPKKGGSFLQAERE